MAVGWGRGWGKLEAKKKARVARLCEHKILGNVTLFVDPMV